MASLSERESEESRSRRRAGFRVVKGGAAGGGIDTNTTTDLTKLPPGFLEGKGGGSLMGWLCGASGCLASPEWDAGCYAALLSGGVQLCMGPTRLPALPCPAANATSLANHVSLPHSGTSHILAVSPADIRLVECVGEGSFGEVWLAEYCGALVAVKILAKVGRWGCRFEVWAVVRATGQMLRTRGVGADPIMPHQKWGARVAMSSL